jgi:hypothetical protein
VDDQQQQRINRAAQEFTDALVAAYRTASDNTAVAQQLAPGRSSTSSTP